MDKYQEFLLSGTSNSAYISGVEKKGTSLSSIKAGVLTINQVEDITQNKYTVNLSNRYFEKCYLVVKSKKQEIKPKSNNPYNNIYEFEVDFENKVDGVEVHFHNDLAEPFLISINYVEANKEEYYSKIEKSRIDDLLKTAQIKHSTGVDLINIYFQPCCDEYDNTTIVLYSDEQLMAKYKVDKEAFFKSIGGLAFGTYYYKVIQYDKNGRELVKTDKIKVVLRRPNYSGQHVITI